MAVHSIHGSTASRSKETQLQVRENDTKGPPKRSESTFCGLRSMWLSVAFHSVGELT